MGVRLAIERHKRGVAVASIAVIAVCLFATHKASRGGRDELGGVVTRAYYSVDDGQTYFAAPIDVGYDFSHDGKQAYRAYVFRCGSGKAFVGFLGRRPADHGDAPATPDPRQVSTGSPAAGGIEVRKPGESKWVSLASMEGQAIVRSLCSSGSPEPVLP